jgi:hypothetical protein
LLIRIREAPREGFRVLKKEDYSQKLWDKMGLWPFPKQYHMGTYCNKECRVNEAELKLFDSLAKDKQRAAKVERPVAEEAIQFAIKINKMPSADLAVDEVEEKLYNLIGEYLVPSSKIRIIDLKYFAMYSEVAGFKVAIDGMHNMPEKGIYITLYCINPPGALYDEKEKDPTQIQLNSSFDWNSPYKSQAYIEGFVHYKKVPADKASHLVIDVRKIKVVMKKGKEYYDHEPYAWTILPLFTFDKYVNSGIYQMPLFKGAVSFSILKEIKASTDPWVKMLQITKETDVDTLKPRLQYLFPASVVVRLIDGQREGHYQVPYDWRRISHKYLPQDKLFDYSYNEAVETLLQKEPVLRTLKPKTLTDLEYNLKITKSCVNVFDLRQFAEPEL